MTPADRIHRLVETGKISHEEGDRLLATMSPASAPPRSAWLLLNPFERFGGGWGAAAGGVGAAISVVLGHFGAHSDGFLDVHADPHHAVPLGVTLLEQGVAWVLPALLFWAYARAVTRHVRFIDFLGFVGIARLTQIGQGLASILLAPEIDAATPPKVTLEIVILVAVIIPLFGWFITLLYQGFKNASGLAGPKLVAGFIGVVIAAEVASKAVLAIFH